MKIFSKHGAEAKLSNGLTRAIEFLDTGDYSHTQLELWNEAWQDACQEIEAFEIALKSLSCAIEVIKTKSDRPLFELPLEIRELIIPLLKNTLES